MLYVVKDLNTQCICITAHKKEAFHEMEQLTEQGHEYYAIAAKPDEHGTIEVFGNTIQIYNGMH